MRGEARVIEGASIEVVMRETGRRARGAARALALAALLLGLPPIEPAAEPAR